MTQEVKPIRYGWYSRPDQPVDQPDFNPSFAADCPICEKPITRDDVRTHSVMLNGEQSKSGGEGRSYFFRTHKSCHEKCDEAADSAMMEKMLAEIQI
jgi:hypothetical protein